jgi:hypothetical protein
LFSQTLTPTIERLVPLDDVWLALTLTLTLERQVPLDDVWLALTLTLTLTLTLNLERQVPLDDVWLALCKYFGKGKARALATFKQIDSDRTGTLDVTEFKIFIAMLNLKLKDSELE